MKAQFLGVAELFDAQRNALELHVSSDHEMWPHGRSLCKVFRSDRGYGLVFGHVKRPIGIAGPVNGQAEVRSE